MFIIIPWSLLDFSKARVISNTSIIRHTLSNQNLNIHYKY